MAVRKFDDLQTEVSNILKRSVTEIDTAQLLNDARQELEIRFPYYAFNAGYKFSTVNGTYLYQLFDEWRTINDVYLEQNQTLLPLGKAEYSRVSDLQIFTTGALVSGAISWIPNQKLDSALVNKGQPIDYYVIQKDLSFSGTGDTTYQWGIILTPIPDAVYTIRVQGSQFPPTLPKTIYSTGTVTITGTSATVIGTGTVWDGGVAGNTDLNGFWMAIDGEATPTRIQNVVSATEITLASTHAALSGKTYVITQREDWFTKTYPRLLVAIACSEGFRILGEAQKWQEWMQVAEKREREYKRLNAIQTLGTHHILVPSKGSKRLVIPL